MRSEYEALAAAVEQLAAAGRQDEAEPALERLLQINPREAYAWGLLGAIRVRRGEPAAAREAFARAHELDRRNPQYLNLLGVAEAELGRIDAGIAQVRKALRLQPDHAEAHYNLGKMQLKRGDMSAALESFRRAVALEPRYPGARYYYGKGLTDRGRCEEAIELLEAAVADEPANEWCPIQLARAVRATRGAAAAIDVLERAAARMPHSALVRRSLAHALLAAERYAEGWREYLHRAVVGERSRTTLPVAWPADLDGRSVAIVWEQGLGDIVFFLRYARRAHERGAAITIQVPGRLVAVLARALAFARVVADDAPLDPADFTAYAGDLPFVLGADDALPPLALTPIEDGLREWRGRLAAFGPAPYLGVAWRAGTDFTTGQEFGRNIQSMSKAVDLQSLARAVRGWPGTLVSLQREPRPGECDAFAKAAGRPVLDAAAANDDIDDVLALLGALDDYAGVSSTNVHLRAGLGLGGQVIVPYPPDWRWGGAGAASPWFPGFTVHRQEPGEPWPAVMEPLAAALSGGAV